jgi:His/Glu/Gln/Arg/opine family amino acid ABC transporter permease subunit
MLGYFNFRVIFDYLPLFLEGFLSTGWISLISLLLCLMVGTVACAARLSHSRRFSTPAAVYIESIRSTPLLAQLYFLYFGLPSLGIRLPEIETGILALTLNSGAYMAEILRAGVQSISRGQIEAGISSGLTYFQRLRYLILPQAIGVTIPPLLGQAIVLVKDSALLSLISVLELTRTGQVLTSERFMPAEGFFTVAVLYLVWYFFLKYLSNLWQRRLIYRQHA